jgi:hypothetical protein
MSFQIVIRFLATTWITLCFVSCGDDQAKGRSSGVPGRNTAEATADTGLISSQLHRLRGSPVLSYLGETEQVLSGKLGNLYKIIPNMQLDNEGMDTQNVLTRSGLGRPSAACGVGANFQGITARIEDCRKKNGESSLWVGQVNGAAGEATWQLVALTAEGKEFWQDLRTNMVWSDVVNAGNWCKASGNKQAVSDVLTVNCSIVGEGQSHCAGVLLDGLGENVKWRLPTRGDYLQADLDGLRFVLKKGTTLGSWTATLQAAAVNRDQAWVYHVEEGTLSAEDLASERQVRCIGAALK